MTHVLVRVSAGIIDEVSFFDNASSAVKALKDVVKRMNVRDDDAAVFGPEGLVVNAKNFLDEEDQFIDNEELVEEITSAEEQTKRIYLIGNPNHPLGFMVSSSDDPLGYEDPAEVVSELGQMRKDVGNHLKLYRVVPVEKPIVTRAELERFNAENEIEDFVFPLVEEYAAS